MEKTGRDLTARAEDFMREVREVRRAGFLSLQASASPLSSKGELVPAVVFNQIAADYTRFGASLLRNIANNFLRMCQEQQRPIPDDLRPEITKLLKHELDSNIRSYKAHVDADDLFALTLYNGYAPLEWMREQAQQIAGEHAYLLKNFGDKDYISIAKRPGLDPLQKIREKLAGLMRDYYATGEVYFSCEEP